MSGCGNVENSGATPVGPCCRPKHVRRSFFGLFLGSCPWFLKVAFLACFGLFGRFLFLADRLSACRPCSGSLIAPDLTFVVSVVSLACGRGEHFLALLATLWRGFLCSCLATFLAFCQINYRTTFWPFVQFGSCSVDVSRFCVVVSAPQGRAETCAFVQWVACFGWWIVRFLVARFRRFRVPPDRFVPVGGSWFRRASGGSVVPAPVGKHVRRWLLGSWLVLWSTFPFFVDVVKRFLGWHSSAPSARGGGRLRSGKSR